jgi:hypothetical protein|eukprot:COSAG01_NODE_974_length_12367_cov_33.179899_5_plen_576_part_00
MIITVIFMVFHLMAQPYPAEFMLVGLMECIGILTIFFTYGAVLLMDEKVTPKGDTDEWTGRDTFFLALIMFWNLLFMVSIGIMILHDISRNAQHHVQEHGMKASFQHLKDAIKEKAKVDKIKNTLVKVKQLGSPSMRDAAREAERRQSGTKVKGSLASLRAQREKRQKKEASRLMWLRGLSGAQALARMNNAEMVMSGLDDEQHAQAVRTAKSVSEQVGRSGPASSEEVAALRRENEELKKKLEKLGKKNVSNMFRLGVRESKILDLKIGGARPSQRPDVSLEDVDASLQHEKEAERLQHQEDMKDVNAVKGADGRKLVHQKWAEPPTQPTGSVKEEDEVSLPEPVTIRDTVAHEPPPKTRDLSQDVGNALFYDQSVDRAVAGHNSKVFLGAVQKVRRAGHLNKVLRGKLEKKVGMDADWFAQTVGADVLTPGSASSNASKDVASARVHMTNPGLRAAAASAGAPASVLSSRSNAELVSAAAAERQQQQQRARKSAHPDTGASGTPLDLDAVEKGLGKVQPLSQEQIQGQVDEWNELQRQAHVRAMQTKLRMLSQFSASSLSESVNPRQGKDVAP